MFEKQRKLFVDIDGTLAVWQVGTPYEELLKRGYFRNLPAHESVVQAVRMLIAEEKELGFETYALSALMPGNPWAEEDKRVWLTEHLPELAASRAPTRPESFPKSLGESIADLSCWMIILKTSMPGNRLAEKESN